MTPEDSSEALSPLPSLMSHHLLSHLPDRPATLHGDMHDRQQLLITPSLQGSALVTEDLK